MTKLVRARVARVKYGGILGDRHSLIGRDNEVLMDVANEMINYI